MFLPMEDEATAFFSVWEQELELEHGAEATVFFSILVEKRMNRNMKLWLHHFSISR